MFIMKEMSKIIMGRPKLKEEDKKIALSLTLSPEIHKLISDVKNKSQFVEMLILTHYNNKKNKE
jgi:hypothetical protein